MSVIARRIRATPERSAVETWKFIVNLISATSSGVRRELEAATGVAACMIADETPGVAPIIVAGCGPRLRIYCLYGEDAITGESSNEAEVTWNPTAEEWTLWLPAPSEAIGWVRAELAKCGRRILAYDPEEEEPSTTPKREGLAELGTNIEAFKRL